MLKDVDDAKEMFGEDFQELLEGLVEEVRQNIADSQSRLENESQWNQGLLDFALAKLHGLKGITGQFGFSFISKVIHEVEDKFVAFKSKDLLPPDAYIFGLNQLFDSLEEYIILLEDVEQITTEVINPICEQINIAKDLKSQMSQTTNQSQVSISQQSDLKNYQLNQDSFNHIFSEMIQTLNEFKESNVERSLQFKTQESIYGLSQARLVSLRPMGKRIKKLVEKTSEQLEKDIIFELIGEEVKFDRVIYSSLSEILVHLIKNSIDHGIEATETRLSKDKNAQGQVSLEFKSDDKGFQVILKDDGKGLDPELIAKLAIDKNVVTLEETKTMTDYEKQFLIFAPGFSTKDAANELSGRGVGMDAVIKDVKKFGGKLTFESNINQGTTFFINWPLTYKLTSSLLFKMDDELLALPAIGVKAILTDQHSFKKVPGAIEISKSLEILPLIEFDFIKSSSPTAILVLDGGGFDVALEVDEVTKVEDIFFQAVSPSELLSPLVNGITRYDHEKYLLSIDINEISSNLNDYMGENESLEQETTKTKENEMDDVLKFESLGGSVTREDLYEFINDSTFIGQIQDILEPISKNQELVDKLMYFVANHFDTFKDTIDEVDVSDELEYMVAMKYAYLKSDWIMYNVQIQYKSMSGADLSEEIVYKAALCSAMIEKFETITNQDAIKKITEALAEPNGNVA